MALGASRPGLLWLGIRSSLTPGRHCGAVGVTGAFFASSLLAGVLFDVRAAEPWVYAITVIVLLVTGGLAALRPDFPGDAHRPGRDAPLVLTGR